MKRHHDVRKAHPNYLPNDQRLVFCLEDCPPHKKLQIKEASLDEARPLKILSFSVLSEIPIAF
ncbi:hypothetical protein BpHYR1_019654 [Brachionus plicatilis]|uniref:Uncharacterized protein n=1 Tax=Brachionus plicatilis TaxID=10195 RepID=A0A3M7Q8A8_BRAPC|nr:hypothetical protein BpHYR1_019654 [Brachionus plicatilis]